jgi:uncharacterized protein (TIGR02246 family)
MSKESHHQDEQAIRKLDAEWAKAARDKDFGRVVSFYATDGSVVWPTGPAAKGHAAIRAEWEKAYKDLKDPYLDFKPTHIEVASGGDMAFDFGVVYFAPNPKPDDLENIAKYLVVWKREHGHWKVLYDCWNYNHMVAPT